MSDNAPEVVKQAGGKKSAPARPKMIRIIGGPEISPPPGSDFQQVPFTLRGLSRIENLHRADTVVIWPSLAILNNAELQRILIDCANKLDKRYAPPELMGLKCQCIWFEVNEEALREVSHDGYSLCGPVIKKRLHDGLPPTECQKAFRLVADDNNQRPMDLCARTIQSLLAHASSHRESVLAGDWSEYLNSCGRHSIKEDICGIVRLVLTQCISAAYSGAAVAVIFPDNSNPPRRLLIPFIQHATQLHEYAVSIEPDDDARTRALFRLHEFHIKINRLKQIYAVTDRRKSRDIPTSTQKLYELFPYLEIVLNFWLSPFIRGSWESKGDCMVHDAPIKEAGGHFGEMIAAWSRVPGHPKRSFNICKSSADGSQSLTTAGILRDSDFFTLTYRQIINLPSVIRPADDNSPETLPPGNELNPPKMNCEDINSMVQYAPGRVDSEGHALNMVIRYGAGGFVAMPEPPSLEPLLGITTDKYSFVRIELTNRRIQIKGQTNDGYIVEVTLSSGPKHDVPMTVSTFRRFLAFCVAAKLASGASQTGTIDLTEMTIGKHDLSEVVDPVGQGQGHKPGQLIKEAFEDILGFTCNLIQVDPERAKDTRRLHPDFWSIVNFDKLMKQVQKPRKSDTENEDALRKIFSVLKQP